MSLMKKCKNFNEIKISYKENHIRGSVSIAKESRLHFLYNIV